MVSSKMQTRNFIVETKDNMLQMHITTEILSGYFHALFKMNSSHTLEFQCVIYTAIAFIE